MIARRNLVAIAVLSSAVMEVLDTSVVNVSLPHIAGSLSATTVEATWVLTSYLVANAIILPMSGWLANYFGRKRMLLTVVTGFTVSSLLCGLGLSLVPRFTSRPGAGRPSPIQPSPHASASSA
jgi:DHA2 family multidrug resistance protein